jgi:hypothetical protein
MRTKVLLGLAALAVGLSTSVAQNVYSLNVVGYVNVTLTAGQLSLLSLPLAPVDGNFDITNTIVLNDAQDGSVIYKWLPAGHWDPNLYSWYAGGVGWVPDTVISNGQAFFLAPAAAGTVTFVGQVPQGALSYTILPGLQTLANMVPVSTNFPGSTVGNDGDTIYLWNSVSHGWSSTLWSYYSALGGWDNGGVAGNSLQGPVLNPADGVFYANSGAAISFTQNFTVQ